MINLKSIVKVFDGGEGSGHFEHAGRVGQVGGSTRSGAFKSKQNRKYREGHINSAKDIKEKFGDSSGFTSIKKTFYRLTGKNLSDLRNKFEKLLNAYAEEGYGTLSNSERDSLLDSFDSPENSFGSQIRISRLLNNDGNIKSISEIKALYKGYESANKGTGAKVLKTFFVLSRMNENERKDLYDALETARSVYEYSANAYIDMRHAYRDKYRDNKKLSEVENEYLEMSNKVDDFIYKSDKFKGEIHRGMKFHSSDDVLNVIDKLTQGKTVDMQGLSSWSSNEKMATSFKGKKFNAIVFHVENKSGTSIKELSSYPNEDEVLVPTTARYRLKKGSKPMKISEDGSDVSVYDVWLEEV